jgi:hypothetical protein
LLASPRPAVLTRGPRLHRVSALFHVTSVLNRDSITRNGLDWRLMGSATGIAGSTSAEAEGIFLCRDMFEADFFVTLNNTGGDVDIWAVDGVSEAELVDAGSGFLYVPRVIGPQCLDRLAR